jgi:type I restriction enzyme M protein
MLVLHHPLSLKAATSGKDLPTLVTEAMTAIETEFEPLQGVLPREYGIFEPEVLEDLMRLFNSTQIKQATGDIFGRIYEYFLDKFSIQKAHDNGEFFTPSSLVQTIVNVIEPDHGIVFDPACGSGGMFVQSSHFIEHEGGDTARRVVFYGQEKNHDTINLRLLPGAHEKPLGHCLALPGTAAPLPGTGTGLPRRRLH